MKNSTLNKDQALYLRRVQRKVLAAYQAISDLKADIENMSSSVLLGGQEEAMLTTDEVISLYGMSRRQLTSFRGQGLAYFRSKPAKYLKSDIDAFLKKNNYHKTPTGWRIKVKK